MLERKTNVVLRRKNDTPNVLIEEEIRKKEALLLEQIRIYGKEAQVEFSTKGISLGAADELPSKTCMSLREAKNINGELTLGWLCSQISHTNATVNVKNHMDGAQIVMFATSILNNMPGYNFIEICVFLTRVREGRYGGFFGSFDNTSFETWRIGFSNELNKEIAEYSEAMYKIKMEEEFMQKNKGRSEDELRMLTKEELEERKKNTKSIAQRIAESRHFTTSKKRKAEPLDGFPLKADGTVDFSKEAYQKTLKDSIINN